MGNDFQAIQGVLALLQVRSQEGHLPGRLVGPALRRRDADQFVPLGLNLFAQSRRPNGTNIDLDRFEPVVARQLRHTANIEPGRPGPVTGLRRRDMDVARRVDVLAKKNAGMDGVGIAVSQLLQQILRRHFKYLQRQSDAELDAIGVVAIRLRPHIVLDKEFELAANRRPLLSKNHGNYERQADKKNATHDE